MWLITIQVPINFSTWKKIQFLSHRRRINKPVKQSILLRQRRQIRTGKARISIAFDNDGLPFMIILRTIYESKNQYSMSH